MASVPFTQFLRPDGHKKHLVIDRPDHIAKAADKIRQHGFRFEIEQLSTGEIHMTITDDCDDYIERLCRNEPGTVALTVDKLIQAFDLGAALKRRRQMNA